MLKVVLGATVVLAANAAQAATIGIEAGQTVNGRPNEGLFSNYVNSLGLFTERFNTSAAPTTCGVTHNNIAISNLGTGDAGLASGRFVHRALPPGTNSASIAAGRADTDKSCYLSLPNPLSPANQVATVNPATLTFNIGRGTPILYLGWYWGSIDPYNSVSFFDKAGNTINFSQVPGSFGTGTITGQDIINLFGLGVAESRFIDFRFTAADHLGSVLFRSGNTAFELDNLSYATFDPVPGGAGIQPNLLVPEPALAGLFGLGMIGLMAGRTRRGARS